MTRGKINKHLFYIIAPTIFLIMNYGDMRAYAPFTIYLTLLLLGLVVTDIYFILRKKYTYNILNVLITASMTLCTLQTIYVKTQIIGKGTQFLFIVIAILFAISTGISFVNAMKKGFMEKVELK